MADKKFAPIIFDRWTPFSYKGAISDRDSSGIGWLAPRWIGEENMRRIQAYSFLRGYLDNVARLYSSQFTIEERLAAEKRREYGDAFLLVETGRSKMMGDQQTIVVANAEKFDEAAGDENTPEAKAAAERQDQLRQWADDDRFGTKLTETERNSAGLGDGLYTLSWAGPKKRPVLLPYEPECYFPVLSSVQNGEYPTKIHLAWELTDDEVKAKYGGSDTVVHRITFELVPVEDVGLKPYRLKYNTEDSLVICVMTEAEFKLGNGSRSVDDLDITSAYFMLDDTGAKVDRKPLGIDFIPAIHIPNTVAEIEHFGRSLLAPNLQLLDDIYSVDSDLQLSSDLTGSPTLVFHGGKIDDSESVGPGKSFSIPDSAGGVDVISGRDGIEGLMAHRDGLLDRLAINSRITNAAQGRVNPEKLQAGIILQLSFGPLTSLIDEMRLARKDKYRLLLKFVQRFMIEAGEWGGEVLEADLAFGAYLPSDRTAMVTDVTSAYAAKLISAETAIRMLIEVGFPIDDIAEELQKIDARDYAGAGLLLDATGNEQAVGDMLGVKVDRPDPPEVVVNPPDPNNPVPKDSPQ